VFDPDGSLVGTTTSYPSSTAVPGGAVLRLAAVTRVGVRADRTRRGLATALMRAQLDDLRARGDALAMLWASESGIYGRYGYGVTTRARSVRVRASRTALRPQAPSGGTVRLLDREDIVPVLSALHDRLALCRPGGITRPPGWWELGMSRHADDPVLAAVHTAPDGGDDGFALAVPRWPGMFAPGDGGGVLQVEDLHAADAAAAAGLWRFLLGVDLIAHVEAAVALDDPLDLLLADPRHAAGDGIADETWLRLVDVPAALGARTFAVGAGAGCGPTGASDPTGTPDPAGAEAPYSVLLAVHDPLLPDNAGIYRVAATGAERVGPLGAGEPELSCDVAALAMAYLGDRSPSALAATGWWTAHDPAALPRADALFATDVVPWCGTHF
jgi:predicted acetyltransferase